MGSLVAKIAFQPPKPSTYSQESLLSNLRQNERLLWAKSGINRVAVVFISHQKAVQTLIYSHGNAEDLGILLPIVRDLSRILRVNVCAYDYSGYGISEGIPEEASVLRDINAVFSLVTSTLQISPKSIVLFGKSIGSGPTVHLGSQLSAADFAGVILQAPIASCIRVASSIEVTPPFDMFPNIDKIPRMSAPLLILHGTEDEIVNIDHGRSLFEAAGSGWKDIVEIPGAHHNDIEARHAVALFESISRFLGILRRERRCEA